MRTLIVAALVLGFAGTSASQDVAQQVRQTRDGTVHLVFAAKPGVCGDGEHHISMGRGNNNCDCADGPVRVDLTVENGAVTGIDTHVGGKQPLNVSTRAATDFLLDLAEHSTRSRVAREAVFPAVIADSVDVAPKLLRVAKNTQTSSEARKAAIFWLGQAAGEKATQGLKDLLSDDDREIKKQAVFALSQIRGESSVDALIDVVKKSQDREVRKSALFWLSQSDNPKVIALFEDILLKH